jgi:hypothetical protein
MIVQPTPEKCDNCQRIDRGELRLEHGKWKCSPCFIDHRFACSDCFDHGVSRGGMIALDRWHKLTEQLAYLSGVAGTMRTDAEITVWLDGWDHQSVAVERTGVVRVGVIDPRHAPTIDLIEQLVGR